MHPIVSPLSVSGMVDPWIAHFLPVALKGSLLVGSLLLGGRLLRSASAASRHLMWTLGMGGLLLLPILEAGLPSWGVIPVPDAITALVADPTPGRTGPELAPVGGAPIGAAAVSLRPKDSRRPGAPGEIARVDAPAVAGSHDLALLSAQGKPRVGGSGVTWGLPCWLAGMFVVALAFAGGLIKLKRIRREARALTSDGWPRLLQSLRRGLSLEADPVLLVSPRALAPMTWGVRRPIVLLPRDCHEWPEELRRQVLLHELAHVRRRDGLTQLIAQCACLVHWFNPLVWIAARQMRVEREQACDDLVLGTGARPSTYASHLLQFACQLSGRERALSMGQPLARRSHIFARVDAVLDPRRCRRAPDRCTLALASALILTVVTGLSTLGPTAHARDGDAKSSRAANPFHALPSPERPDLSQACERSLSSPDPFASGRPLSCEFRVDGITVKMETEGGVQFNGDHTGIERLEDGARFAIEEKRGRRRTSLRVTPGGEGRPVYDFRVGRSSRPFDAEGAAWLAKSIEFLLLEAAIDADVRVRRVYKEAGLPGVQALIESVESEHTRGVYCAEFLGLDNLGDEEIVEILRRIRSDFESDHTRANILVAYVDDHLRRTSTREAFLATLAAMKSDHEVRRVLESALDANGRTPEELAVLLAALPNVRSDYESAQFLSAFGPELLADEATSRAYFTVLEGLDSDYEKAGVLISLVRRTTNDDRLRTDCLAAAERLRSYHEYSRVMRALRPRT